MILNGLRFATGLAWVSLPLLFAGLLLGLVWPSSNSFLESAESDTLAHEFDADCSGCGMVMPPTWDWRLLKAMVRQESNYNAQATSGGGAVGLTQMLPATARNMGLNSRQFYDPKPTSWLALGTCGKSMIVFIRCRIRRRIGIVPG